MKLSAAILFDELQKSYVGVRIFGQMDRCVELALSSPLFFDPTIADGIQCVYIVRQPLSIRGATVTGCLFICTGISEDFPVGDNILITIEQDVDAQTLHNFMTGIFHKYEIWDKTLMDLVLHAASITDYLECSFPVFENPMIVLDHNYRYIARAGIETLPKQYSYFGDLEFIDPEFLHTSPETTELLRSAHDIISYRNPQISGEFLLLNLYNGNLITGLLVVGDYVNPFRTKDRPLLNHLAQYLQAALLFGGYSAENKSHLRNLMLQLLNGQKCKADEIKLLQRQTSVLDLQKDDHFYCLSVITEGSHLTGEYVAHQLEFALPRAVAIPHGAAIAALVTSNQTWESFGEQMSNTLAELSLHCGCSDAFTDFSAIGDYYKQANVALHMGMNAKADHMLHRFSDYVLEHFIQYGCSVIPAQLLCADCVKRMAERDKTSSVSYCESLRVYLDTGRNLSETARRLYIQRNTLIARLERIMRYVDLDLGNPDQRLYLELSLRVVGLQYILNRTEEKR
ncbi:MAG: helix-turn-helix domain-containing protein [Clostridiales bacterium]|nr:helix-turn-helix domain-containing protein [Clostridiales bacterium]